MIFSKAVLTILINFFVQEKTQFIDRQIYKIVGSGVIVKKKDHPCDCYERLNISKSALLIVIKYCVVYV